MGNETKSITLSEIGPANEKKLTQQTDNAEWQANFPDLNIYGGKKKKDMYYLFCKIQMNE